MHGIVRLVYVSKNDKPYFPRYRQATQQFFAIIQPDRVEPATLHQRGRVVLQYAP